MKVADYKVVSGSNSKELETIVNEWIDKGYQPLGGVAATNPAEGRSDLLHQSLILTRRANSKRVIQDLKQAGFHVQQKNGTGSTAASNPKYVVR